VLAITGNVESAGTLDNGGADVTISGSQTPNFSTSVLFPTVDYTYYQAIAQANGQYINGDRTYTSASPLPDNPAGGVVFVNGNVTIQGDQLGKDLSLVTTGNIVMNKTGSTYPRIEITRVAPYPAIVAQGNVTFTSTGNGGAYLDVTGLIYTGGNFTFTSGNHDELSIVGNLIAAGNITVSPTAQNTITMDYSASTPPGFDIGPVDMQVVSYNS
jgi:hypothetical protein